MDSQEFEHNSGRQRVTVMLVDDHSIWREGIKSMLEETEFHVIAESSSAREAREMLSSRAPDLMLLDIRLPDCNGLEILTDLKETHPRMAVVILTAFDDPTFQVRALAGGASAYLLKGVDAESLLKALRTAITGDIWIASKNLAAELRAVSARSIGQEGLLAPLTSREREVLSLLAAGLTNRQIGKVLMVTENTIKTHIRHVMDKLGVSDRVSMAVWAAKHALTLEYRPIE